MTILTTVSLFGSSILVSMRPAGKTVAAPQKKDFQITTHGSFCKCLLSNTGKLKIPGAIEIANNSSIPFNEIEIKRLLGQVKLSKIATDLHR